LFTDGEAGAILLLQKEPLTSGAVNLISQKREVTSGLLFFVFWRIISIGVFGKPLPQGYIRIARRFYLSASPICTGVSSVKSRTYASADKYSFLHYLRHARFYKYC
jgi:hypothetical protein